jgi:hypothetical protein
MKKHIIRFIRFYIILISVACNQVTPSGQNELAVTEPNSAPTSQSTIGTEQRTPEPNTTPILKIIPTQTETPVPTPAWTPLPTLPPIQAQAFALKMMKTNGGCQLPCWLEITPGITTWPEAYAFLATFADSIYSPDASGGSAEVSFKFPNTSYRGVPETAATIRVKSDGMIDQIMTPMDISLPDLLATYGPPTEIRILAIVATMDPVGRFTLVLFYKDKGIMAVYDGKNEKEQIIHICPNHIQGPQQRWLLWDSADQLTFAEAGTQTLLISPVPPPSEKDFIPLEKLTDLSIESFYQRYKDPKNQGVCMEMQAPDWP